MRLIEAALSEALGRHGHRKHQVRARFPTNAIGQ
jgi:hypothetical protein